MIDLVGMLLSSRVALAVRLATGIVVSACLAGALAGACKEYDSSLLRYSDPTPADAAADQEAGAAPESGPEADVSIDSGWDGDAAEEPESQPNVAIDSPEEDTAPACSATLVDCDGDEANGCETDLTTDPKNCGACAHDCLRGTCAGGRCQPFVLATGPSWPGNVALDASHLYWGAQGPGGGVMRVSTSGGPVEVVAQGALPPGGIAVDDEAVFWSEFGSGGSVWRLAKSDIGTAVPPTELASGQGQSIAVALEGNRVYWVTPGTVRWTAKDGSDVVHTIASGQETPAGLVVQVGIAFWTNFMGGTVVGLDTSSDAGVHVFATGQGFPSGITADIGNLYWANNVGDADGGTPAIMRIAKVNMPSPQVLTANQVGPLGVAQYGSHVYWTNNSGGTVMRVSKSGGSAETLATGQAAPAGIAVDAHAVYWVNRDDGTVMGLAH